MSSKKYKTIVIDPPWPIKFLKVDDKRRHGKGKTKQNKIKYDVMTEDEIKQFPINDYAADECVLFMWTTMTYLPLSLKILDYWGFKYHGTLAWYKNQGMVMFGFKRNVEFVIVAYKGKLKLIQNGKQIYACFKADAIKHSQKPRIFYDMLLHSTYEPRIDIFSRKKHIGFDSYGNEAEEPLTLETFSN